MSDGYECILTGLSSIIVDINFISDLINRIVVLLAIFTLKSCYFITTTS